MAEKKKEIKKDVSVEKKSRFSVMKKLVKRKAQEETKKLEKEKVKGLEKEKISSIVDPFTILKFVLMTEKAIQLIERENKLVFIVDKKYSRVDIKKASESAFQASVKDVKTLIDQKGRKKAFIKFKEPGVAGDIAMRLGII